MRSKATALAKKSFAYAKSRLASTGWWLDSWSLVDVYLNWAVSVARKTGFDFQAYPAIDGLRSRLADLAAFRRMLEIEDEAGASLKVRCARS